jgi:F0F1-type ATP synthase membrane subunit c/vacuolar-type H+-ATPase subunit K
MSKGHRSGRDPGWRIPLSGMLPLPQLGMARLKKQGRLDGLTLTRILFLSFVFALLAFWLVLMVRAPWDGGDEGWIPWAVGGYGLASVAIVWSILRRPLDGASNQTALAGAWRTRFFLAVAFAETAALVGFVGVILTQSLWVYFLGLVFSLFDLWLLAPSARNLDRDQERLREAGSSLSLRRALSGARRR